LDKIVRVQYTASNCAIVVTIVLLQGGHNEAVCQLVEAVQETRKKEFEAAVVKVKKKKDDQSISVKSIWQVGIFLLFEQENVRLSVLIML
jgi:hypothetical protein